MIEIPEAWKALATITIDTLMQIEKGTGRNKPLWQAVLEFGQFMSLLAMAGMHEEGADSDDKSDSGAGSTEDT